MLSFSELKKYYPENVFKDNKNLVLVEYIQYELLDSIFKTKGSEKISFMGGTAIRIVYDSSRFSEDLDFDNFGLSFDEFSDLLNRVVTDMEQKGFEIEFRLLEKGAYHCYIKFPNLLYRNNLSNNKDGKILVRIDTVNKEKRFEPKLAKLDKFDIYQDIRVDPVDIILAQKFATVIQRKRPKGRDFYDISYLLGFATPNYDFLREEYKIEDRKDLKERVLKKCAQIDFKEMEKGTQPFLINPAKDKERILTFREYIKQKL